VEPPTETISWTFDVNFGIAEDLLDRVESTTEEILAQLFETSTSEGGVEVVTLKEGADSMMFG
jgi:hypothetical protein